MTTESVAKILGVSEKEVRKLVCDGRIPAAKINGRWYIDSGDFDRWQKMGQWKEKVQAAQRIDLDAVVEKLLPFEGRDYHSVWPIGGYQIDASVEITDVWQAQLIPVVSGEPLPMLDVFTSSRAQAIEFCRADLKIRLRAVLEMMGLTAESV